MLEKRVDYEKVPYFPYRDVCLEAPTLRGAVLSLHASINFFKSVRHCRNDEKKG